MKHFSLVLFLGLSLGFAAQPAHAESLLQKWFPQYFGAAATGPQPEDTLVAPFPIEPKAEDIVDDHDLMSLHGQPTNTTEDTIPLNKPHRSPEQVGEWAIDSVGAALSIKAEDDTPESHGRKMQASFDSYALEELQTYLNQSGMYNYTQTNKMDVNAFIDGKPRLLSEGEREGYYRWKYEVPVMLSYIPANTKSMKGVTTHSQKVMVDVAIRRASTQETAEKIKVAGEGLLVESFGLRSAE